jgi:alkaline phosphatase D
MCTTPPRIITTRTRRSFRISSRSGSSSPDRGTYGPNELDNTFGPELRFIKAPGLDKQNLSPSAGMQFFGHVKIDGATGQMTVTLRDRAGVALWSTTLDPKMG